MPTSLVVFVPLAFVSFLFLAGFVLSRTWDRKLNFHRKNCEHGYKVEWIDECPHCRAVGHKEQS